MVANFDNFALLQDDDSVCVPNGRQTMSDDDSCHLTQILLHHVDGLLNFSFVLFIKSARGLIEDQELWLFDESSGQGDSLLFSS